MTTITKNLMGILFGGAAAQPLASADWKSKVNAVYGFTPVGTGYQVFKPGSSFNSLTQLVPDGMYILDVATPGFELPGAVLAVPASAGAGGDNTLSLSSCAGGYAGNKPYRRAVVSYRVNSTDAVDEQLLLVSVAELPSQTPQNGYANQDGNSFVFDLDIKPVAGQMYTLVVVNHQGFRTSQQFVMPADSL